MAEDDRRLELVKGSAPSERETGRVGLGLLIGLAIGHRPLLAAVDGRLDFETALVSFVVIVLIAVGSLLFLGVLYDRFSYVEPQSDDMNGQLSRSKHKDSPLVTAASSADDLVSESHEDSPLAG